MADRLTKEQLEHIERISLTPHRSVSVPTMQLRQLVRELREHRDLAVRIVECFDEGNLYVDHKCNTSECRRETCPCPAIWIVNDAASLAGVS